MNSGEPNNLPELLQLLLQQYQDYVDRKERLENKALGHLTPLLNPVHCRDNPLC
jgi:hypothetical protein